MKITYRNGNKGKVYKIIAYSDDKFFPIKQANTNKNMFFLEVPENWLQNAQPEPEGEQRTEKVNPQE